MKPWEYREEQHGRPSATLTAAPPEPSPPARIQFKHPKSGYTLPAGVVYVGRPSAWGNPFTAKDGYSAAAAVAKFEAYALQRLAEEPAWLEPLQGKSLACWCSLNSEPCHAEVLLSLADDVRRRTSFELPMPPNIQEAYDRGESVTFVKARGRWELYKVLEPPKDLSAGALGLLTLYELGELPQRVHRRLTELFTEQPKDIYERLEKAALFIEEQAA